MSFPFMKDVQLPHYKEDCTAAFFDAIRRLDMESVSQFIEAKPPGFLSSLVDAQGNSPLHVALQVAVAQAATQAFKLLFAFNVQFYRQLITAGRFFTFG